MVANEISSSANKAQTYINEVISNIILEQSNVLDDVYDKIAIITDSSVSYERDMDLRAYQKGRIKDDEEYYYLVSNKTAYLIVIPLVSIGDNYGYLLLSGNANKSEFFGWTTTYYALLIINMIFMVLVALMVRTLFEKYLYLPMSDIITNMSVCEKNEYRHKLNAYEKKGKISEIISLEQHLCTIVTKLKENTSLAAIGQSTAMVAHDVRKPLTSMKALLTALPLIKDNPVELEKMTLMVDNSIHNTNTMLNDILEFSRDSTALHLDKHNPQSIIISALSEALRSHPNSDVKVNYNLKHKDCLHVDGDRIIRVLINIIDNALGAMTKEENCAVGNLWIETSSGMVFPSVHPELVEVSLIVTVANDGPPIPETALGKLFDPFFTQGKKGGTGLGLSICQKIIEMHKGKIGAKNEGGLVKFTLELPAIEGNLAVNEAELINHSSELKIFHEEERKRPDYCDITTTAEFMRINKERGRISYLLIVDDEPLFRETVRTMLYNLGQVKDHVKVIEADGAEAALDIFKTQKFDYVITDIDLGKLRKNGYEFAQEVLEKYPEVYVLIHSNKRRDELDVQIRTTVHHCASRDTFHASRFMGFLPKPMTQSELLQFLACKTFEAAVTSVRPELPLALSLSKDDKAQGERVKLKKVLVVNDDPVMLSMYKFYVKRDGVQLLEASCVSDALKFLVEHKVDIVLSDLNLGEGEPSGYDLLKEVRSKNKDMPFYIVSGYSKSREEPKALELGATAYLQQPVDEEQMNELIN